MFGINKKTTEELLEMIAAGRKVDKAFSEFYDRTEKTLRTYISYMIKGYDEREDIFQESYTAFFKKVRSGFVPNNPSAYLSQISRNLIYKYFRDKKDHIEIDSIAEIGIEENSFENSELVGLIKKAVDLLDPEMREVFILKEFEGFSHKEISEICEISEVNSRSRLFKAFRKINQILKPYITELKENNG